MGIAKKARLAWTINSYPANPDDRKVIKMLIAHEKDERKENQNDVIQDVFLRMKYVGIDPKLNGNYLVSDLATGSLRQVTIGTNLGGQLVAWSNGDRVPMALAVFNLKSYRWFRISHLSPEDLEKLRNLPKC